MQELMCFSSLLATVFWLTAMAIQECRVSCGYSFGEATLFCFGARHITARRRIGARSGRLGLRGAGARRSATWPLASVRLGATSPTCDTLCAMPFSFRA